MKPTAGRGERKVPAADKPFFDTNIAIYAFTASDARKAAAIRLFDKGGTVGVQTLNEFANVASRKLRVPWEQIRQGIEAICLLCPSPVPVTLAIHSHATRIAERWGFGLYDSLMIAAALESGCNILYSEDLQDGQVVEGLTIRNPFLSEMAD